MSKIYFSSAGRLAVWDTIENQDIHDPFLNSLNTQLHEQSYRSIEAPYFELYENSSDVSKSSLIAILEKIICRGLPTLCNLDFEERILKNEEKLDTEDLIDLLWN